MIIWNAAMPPTLLNTLSPKHIPAPSRSPITGINSLSHSDS